MEFTTQQAADFINVPHPFLIEQLEQGLIAYHSIGTQRTIRYEDLKKYKDEIDSKHYQALEELSQIDQELGLGYER